MGCVCVSGCHPNSRQACLLLSGMCVPVGLTVTSRLASDLLHFRVIGDLVRLGSCRQAYLALSSVLASPMFGATTLRWLAGDLLHLRSGYVTGLA